MSDRFFRLLLSHPWWAIVATVLLIAAVGSGARLITFSNDYRMFFSEDNPQLRAFEALQDTYTKNDNVLFVIAPKDGVVFKPETLATVEWLTREAWQIPYSIRVDSISNFQHTSADGDDLLVRDLVSGAPGLDADAIAEAGRIAVAEPLLQNRLIAPRKHVTGVNVTIQLPGEKLTEVPEVAKFANQLAERVRARDPSVDVRLTGMVIMNNAFPEASQQDMKTLYPLMFVLILVILALMLRSVSATVGTALVIVMTIVGTMGLTGWIGIQMSPPTTSVPVIVMTLAVADCVHILVIFLQGLRRGLGRFDAMLESLRINLAPVFLTSITTAIGFLSLNFSDAPPFRDLGNMAAMGVMIAFFLSILFLPALMMLLPVRAPAQTNGRLTTMERFAEFVIRRRQPLFWGMLLVIVGLVSQLPNNRLNDVFVDYFDEEVSFRADTDFATENLTGIYLIEYSLPTDGDSKISDPAFLRNVEAFANWYRDQPGVMHVNVITDIMKRLNKNMHGDDPAWYRLPDANDLSAQYLLLYEFSLPFGLDLNNQINVAKTATRMTVTLETTSTEELLALERRAQGWLTENAPPSMRVDGASSAIMFAHIGHRNIRSMLKGTTIALVLISGILLFALRSVRIGLLSIIPNLVPIGMAFGLWGLLVGQVGLALSVVAGVTIGIVVDDTVHFLSKYLRAQREQGLSREDAVRYAFSTVGMALWVTSLVLIIGFGVLALSTFELNAGMGLLTAITIALALFADFLFLPPLLMKFGGGAHARESAVSTA
ncbi:MAG: MMPL family transporter [Gammaproteobacteria bacterium]|nr:MMPL family transporter [Gammaproteobacteria bacterium]